MAVDSPCREYTLNYPEWRIVRDAIAGERAIKFGDCATDQSGVREHNYDSYLPRAAGMEDEDWDAYISRAHWFGATGRTAHGLQGMIFEKDPVLSVPDTLKPILENIDLAGTHINQFAANLVWDLLPTNWGGILVDYPTVGKGMDKASSEKAGNRAYTAYYCAESIINWRYENRNNVLMLTLVVLKEPYNAVGSDEFSSTIKHKYRVLSLDADGHYNVRIYDDAVDLKAPVESYIPKLAGAPLGSIPFFTLPGNLPEKSMLLDLAYENIGHFQKTADYENGLHYTGVPTPYATKETQPLDQKGDPLPMRLGGSQFLFFPQAETVDYLEFKGAGIEQEKNALGACEARMAILGARIISAEKNGVESAEASRIHRAGENSVLATFANNLSSILSQVAQLLGKWQGIAGAEDASYSLNTDYDASLLDSTSIDSLTKARAAGEIPRSVYFYNLQQGERIPSNMDFEDFEAELENEASKRADAQGGSLLAAATAARMAQVGPGGQPAKVGAQG